MTVCPGCAKVRICRAWGMPGRREGEEEIFLTIHCGAGVSAGNSPACSGPSLGWPSAALQVHVCN